MKFYDHFFETIKNEKIKYIEYIQLLNIIMKCIIIIGILVTIYFFKVIVINELYRKFKLLMNIYNNFLPTQTLRDTKILQVQLIRNNLLNN